MDITVDDIPCSDPHVPDIHLQSPITPHMREHVKKACAHGGLAPLDVPKIARSIGEKIRIMLPTFAIKTESEQMYGTLMDPHSLWVRHDASRPNFISDIWHSIRDVMDQWCGLRRKVHTPLKGVDPEVLRNYRPSDTLSKWNNLRKSLEEWRFMAARKIMSKKDVLEPVALSPGSHYSAWTSGEMSVLVDYSSRIGYLIDYEQILGITDTVTSRELCVLVSELYAMMSLTKMVPSVGLLEKVFHWGDRLLTQLGNEAYNVLKFLEPLSLGVILKRFDTAPWKESFLKEMTESCNSVKMSALNVVTAPAHDLLSIIDVPDISIYQLSEIFGLYRIFSHPTVDEDAACGNVKDIARQDRSVSLPTVMKCEALLKRAFVREYIKVHCRWPPGYVTSAELAPNVHKWHSTGELNFQERGSKYDILEWIAFIPWGCFEFDTHVDYSELLDDKALSPKRSEIETVYDPTLLRRSPREATSSRRVLIEVLSRPTLDCKQIINRVNERTIPREWKVVGVHSKEREMKVNSRLFAMMVLDMRVYFVLTEKNTAEHVFPYFPQQTMTMSEVQVGQRLMSLFESSKNPRILTVFYTIDFSKWNLRWRAESTGRIFKMIGEMFKMPDLYTYTHEFFSEVLVYLMSRYHPPSSMCGPTASSPRECETLWYNHIGGFEGLRQKPWTLCTIAGLLLVEHLTGLRATITGQGDNQVLAVDVPIPSAFKDKEDFVTAGSLHLTEVLEKYMDTLSEVFEGLALPIKKEESWGSVNFVAYGKDLMYKGAFLPMVMKKICRVMPEVNDVYPSLESKVATIFAGGQSCTPKGFEFLVPMIVAGREARKVIREDLSDSLIREGSLWRELQSRSGLSRGEITEALATVPKSFGGLPVLLMTDVVYRGHPDQVAGHAALTKAIGKTQSNKFRLTAASKLCDPENHRTPPDLRMLVQDPRAVNLNTPALPCNVLQHILDAKLNAGWVVNKDVVDLFTFRDNGGLSILEVLYSARPFHPRVVNVLFQASPLGTLNGFLACFSHNRTMKILNRGSGQFLLDRIAAVEISMVYHVVMLVSRAKISLLDESCSSTFVQRARDISWQLPDGGRVEGVTCPHPMEQFSLHLLQDGECKCCQDGNKDYILYIVDSCNESRVATRGSHTPYMGSRTRERTSTKLVGLVKSDKPLTSAIRVSQIRPWICSEGSNLDQFIDCLVRSRCDINPSFLNETCGGIHRGSLTHRLNDHAGKQTSLINIRPNIASHIYLSTDTLQTYGMSRDNYTIMFQAAMLFGITNIAMDELLGHLPREQCIYHQHIQCEPCTQKIEESPMDITTQVGKVPTLRTNRLIYASSRVQLDLPVRIRSGQCQELDKMWNGKDHLKVASAAVGYLMTGDLRHLLLTKGSSRFTLNLPRCDFSMSDIRHLDLDWFLSQCLLRLILPLVRVVASDKLPWVTDVRKYLRAKIEVLDLRGMGDILPFLELTRLKTQLVNLSGMQRPPPVFARRSFSLELQIRLALLNILSGWFAGIGDVPRLVIFTNSETDQKRVMEQWMDEMVMRSSVRYPRDRKKITSLRVQFSKILNSVKDEKWSDSSFHTSLMEGIRIIKEGRFTILPSETLGGPTISSIAPEFWISSMRDAGEVPVIFGNIQREIRGVRDMRAYIAPPRVRMSLRGPRGEVEALNPMTSDTVRAGVSPNWNHFHQSRGLGASTPYIYLPTLIHNIVRCKNAVVLGDGEGGLTRLMMNLYAPSHIFFNTLVDTSSIPQHRLPNLVPSELIDKYPNPCLPWLTQSLTGITDVLHPSFVNFLMSVVGKEKRFDVVLSDVEFSLTDRHLNRTLHLIKVLHRIISELCTESGVGICKISATNFKSMKIILCFASRLFQSVEVERADFSNPGGVGLLLIMRHPTLIMGGALKVGIPSTDIGWNIILDDFLEQCLTPRAPLEDGDRLIAPLEVAMDNLGYEPNLRQHMCLLFRRAFTQDDPFDVRSLGSLAGRIMDDRRTRLESDLEVAAASGERYHPTFPGINTTLSIYLERSCVASRVCGLLIRVVSARDRPVPIAKCQEMVSDLPKQSLVVKWKGKTLWTRPFPPLNSWLKGSGRSLMFVMSGLRK